MAEEGKRLGEEEFVIEAVKKLRKDPFRGIHSVYNGFNEAFRKYFGSNPVEATTPHITEEEFIIEGIKRLRKEPYKGIHSVYSGLNDAFRKHFNKDPIEFTGKMASDGKIEIIPLKSGKGVMLYLPGEGPRGRKTERVDESAAFISKKGEMALLILKESRIHFFRTERVKKRD